jgi:membrane-bound ClpP family serine protease
MTLTKKDIDDLGNLGCFFLVLAFLALLTIPSAFLAWILMLSFGALDHPVPFLPIWGIVFVLGCLFGRAKASK